MLEACRTCLKLININNSPFYEIKVDEVQPPAESCRYKLLNIVPDMALNITPKSILCAECHGSLESVFEFKKKCLKTENIIAQYIQSKRDLDIKNLDLKDISAFNTGDIKISEDKSVGVLVDEVIVKEGVETYDTAFVKHEVDNFSFESVDVAVPHSSAEIKISEEEAVEASIKVVAVQKEVEFSDNVVSNVKHEVNDFSTESVEVVLPKNVMPGSNFTCEYCDMRCKRSSSLKMHLRTHTGEKSHLCKICNRRFLKKYNLTLHLRIHTGERPYVCEICCKDFRTKSKLTLHMRSHTGEKPYCCEICDCRFHLKHHLTNHLRTHTAEKPYHCETCNRSFEQKSKLTKHLSIHTGKQPYVEKPYCCKICHFRFLMQSSLTDHMRTHTGEKPYRCEICDRGFALKSNLTKHIRIHTGERPYVCNICGKGYPSSGSLKKHIRTNHKEQQHQLEKGEERPVDTHTQQKALLTQAPSVEAHKESG